MNEQQLMIEKMLEDRVAKQNSIRDKLIQIASDRQRTSALGRPIAQAVDFFTGMNPETKGTNLAGNYPTNYQSQAITAQLANTSKEDALKGLLNFRTGVAKQKDLESKEKAKVEKDYRTMFRDFTRDALVKDILEEQMSFDRAKSLADLNNPVTTNVFKRAMIRLSGEKGGRFSDQDVKQFGGSQALVDRIEQVTEEVLTGKFSETNIRYYKELMRHLKKMNNRNLTAKIEGFAQIAPQAYGVEEGVAKDLLQKRIGVTLGDYIPIEEKKEKPMTEKEKKINEIKAKIAKAKGGM